MGRGEVSRMRAVVGATLLGLLVGAALSPTAAADAASRDRSPRLHLVTFDAAGTAARPGPRVPHRRQVLQRQQDVALARVGAPAPTYRWTTALSGVAVALSPSQAEALRSQPEVALVEQNSVRRLAGRAPGTAARVAVPRGSGGAGVVVGVVDSGVWPESPLFTETPALGRAARAFAGECQPGEDWDDDSCSRKLVGARWFVEGFGVDAVSSVESLSARDVLGHGTQVASVAVGNARVSTGVPGLPAHYSGTAPRARLAVYKACWRAPDPRDDGCATADLVTAVDRAVADGVDVLNLSVTGAAGTGALERALLGAAEADVVVVGAAGNSREAYAAGQPWITTVGGLAGTGGTGAVVLPGDVRLAGAMTVRLEVRARLVLGRDVPAEGWSREESRACLPGSLDAARVAGSVVVCERGGIGRLEKSTAVERADGIGMVLVNLAPGDVAHDLHAVPTVHLGLEAGRTLLRRVADRVRPVVRLVPGMRREAPLRVPAWSTGGDPTGSFVKPDVVAPATGVLAATPPGVAGDGRWGVLNGTSAAAARVSGAAAVLRSRRGWSAPVIRSALTTSAAPARGGALHAGAGRTRPDVALRTRLAYVENPRRYRTWLEGRAAGVNTPSLLLRGGGPSATRRITNLDDHARYWSVQVSGFERHDVRVTPAAVRLGPGESAAFTVTVAGGAAAGPLDDGTVTWRGPGSVPVRIPVVIGR